MKIFSHKPAPNLNNLAGVRQGGLTGHTCQCRQHELEACEARPISQLPISPAPNLPSTRLQTFEKENTK
jgi:hypothetical protein